MKPELELIFETQIANVAHCSSSIFSREDVIIILKTVRQYISELPEVVQEPTNGFTHQFILNAVKDMLDNYDFDNYIEIDPELCGSYGGSYSLEFNTRFDESQFIRDFLCELPDSLESNKTEE